MEGTDESQESKVVVGRLNEDEWAGCDKQVIAEEEHADDLDPLLVLMVDGGVVVFVRFHGFHSSNRSMRDCGNRVSLHHSRRSA